MYRRSKGALVLDHDGYLPQFAVVTAGKTAEIEVARRQRFEPGTMLVFERGYTDVDWWLELSQQNVFFVTRLKDNIDYGVVEQRTVRPASEVVRDEVGLLTKIQDEGPAGRSSSRCGSRPL